MALVLAIGLPLQPGLPRAQETTVDCAANPDQEACKNQEAAPAEEAPATDAPAEEAAARKACFLSFALLLLSSKCDGRKTFLSFTN